MSSAMGSCHSANSPSKSSKSAEFPPTVRSDQALTLFASRFRACSSIFVKFVHRRGTLRVALRNSTPSYVSPLRALTYFIRNASFIAYISGDGECMATGGGKVARSCPSDECCSPRPLNLGRLSLARPRSPAPAFAVARGMAWLNAPIDVAPTKEGVPVHPHFNPRRRVPEALATNHPTTNIRTPPHDPHGQHRTRHTRD